jgi:DNA-binding ferritin-like protein
VKAIREDYVNTSSDYEEEDDLDFETSIPQLNARINSLIERYHEQIRLSSNADERRLKQEMAQKIVDEIETTIEKRQNKNLRPLDTVDFEHPYARELYDYLLDHPRY